MPNTLVRATAEGLPKITRRSVLAGMAASSAVGGAGVASASGHPDATLLALGRDLEAALGRLDAAVAAKHEAASLAKWMAPELPEDLVAPRQHGLRFCDCETERDVLETPVYSEVSSRPSRLVMTAHALKRAAEHWPDADTYPGNEVRRLLPIAASYESACERIRKDSGYDAANSAVWNAGSAVRAVIKGIVAEPATTPAGLRVKALACRADAIEMNANNHYTIYIRDAEAALVDAALAVLGGEA